MKKNNLNSLIHFWATYLNHVSRSVGNFFRFFFFYKFWQSFFEKIKIIDQIMFLKRKEKKRKTKIQATISEKSILLSLIEQNE
jgi:hypothetical protein